MTSRPSLPKDIFPFARGSHFWKQYKITEIIPIRSVPISKLSGNLSRCKGNAGSRNVSLLIPYLYIWEGHTLGFLGMKDHGPAKMRVCIKAKMLVAKYYLQEDNAIFKMTVIKVK